jgi:hypothetical protein
VGTDAKGQAIEKYLDLAYVHINIGNVAHCLGTHLDYGCDPCTKPFPWGKF